MNTNLLVTIITSAASLLTATIVAYVNVKNVRKIENLKKDIAAKSKKDDEIFKFLLTYETETVSQYLRSLKEILQCSQEAKDKIRELHRNQSLIQKEKKLKSDLIKEDVIRTYSSNVYYYNLSDRKSIAHSMKNLLLDLINILQSDSENTFDKKFSQISELQRELQHEVNIEINNALKRIRERSN